jgi:pimeloyl-ACP methyl ester carboxylesterase
VPDIPAPDWFTAALAVVPESHEVEVDGCPIRYLSWGDRGAPGVVLIHGGAAHARWWSHLGPHLAGGGRHHVVALDLSGHGDSGWRERYRLDGWADEVLAVADHSGMAEPPAVIGHSMGGFVAIGAAARHGDRLAGAIVVDSPVRKPDPESEEGRGGRMFRAPKTYPALETAMEHFHLVPPQPPPPPYVVEHVARHSLRETDDGWTWKFDPALFIRREQRQPGDYGAELSQVRCRLAVLHGERSSIVDERITDYMAERLGRAAPFVEIPDAHHHLILDQPLAFLAAVRALLADWEHSVPRRIPGLV